MRHVLARPATAAQRDRAQESLTASEQEAADLAAWSGTPTPYLTNTVTCRATSVNGIWMST